MFDPPPSDRELSEELVRLAMHQQFPHLDLQQVECLGSGWEYDVYLIDGHLVVRFPRYAEVAEGLDRAEALLAFVGAELGSEVTVPRITLRGEGGSHFPHPFFGHELVPGVPASERIAPWSGDLALDLGHALTQIHRISPDRASRLGVGPQKWSCRSSFDALVEVIEAVPEASALVPEAAAWVQSLPNPPAEYAAAPRFIHDDFQPEHIIVHVDSGRLSGIIDWGAALGDPAQDFSFVAAWRGWDFTRSVLEAYHGIVDADFVGRLLFLGRVRALGWLAYEVQMGIDTSRTVDVVRDLFARERAT
ncbi:MAG: aminoglycoside phosphotransferase family protein [Gemmatimonadota bacterium]